MVHKGLVKPIHIQLEDRAGGRKHITRITHVESFGIDPEELGNLMQKRFSAASSVTRLPGKNETGKEIALQVCWAELSICTAVNVARYVPLLTRHFAETLQCW